MTRINMRGAVAFLPGTKKRFLAPIPIKTESKNRFIGILVRTHFVDASRQDFVFLHVGQVRRVQHFGNAGNRLRNFIQHTEWFLRSGAVGFHYGKPRF